MSARNEDFLFAQEAQNLGYVTEEQVDEGFLLQRRMANDLQIDERLAVILVKRGWMAEEQARRVYGIIEPKGQHNEIEGYRLVQKIGGGAMGTVYKAIHEGLHRVVAIKILRRDLAADRTQIERLKREAKLLADLEHPNIVRAFDAGESNGFPYLVLEYVDGETLRDRIAREGALSNEEALRITRALADALEKARRMGIVHRDVKPGNILIAKAGGVPKLMDLGLAKGPVDLELTQQGATVGTPQFMSPEQAASPDKVDIRSDIYSLGATLYAMVTTRPPFEGTTLAEIITKVMTRQPIPPRVRNEDVSPEVSHLIERMMLKDPSLRYATPAQVVEDIDMIRGGQSIIPRGFQGNWEAFLLRQRWRRRKKWLMTAGAAVLVLSIGLVMLFKKIERDDNQAAANEAAELVLRVPEPGGGIVRKTLELHAEEARSQFETMESIEARAGVQAQRGKEAKLHLARLEEALKVLDEYESRKSEWDKGLAAGRYRDVYSRAQDFKSRVLGHEPAHTRWSRYLDEIKTASELAWQRAQGEVLGRSAPDLRSFVTQWQDYQKALAGDFLITPALTEARNNARPIAAAAERIGKEVSALETDFSPKAITPRIEAFKLHEVHEDLAKRRARLLQVVEAEKRVFARKGAPVGKGALNGPRGLVTAVLARLANGLDAAVYARWEAILVEVESLEAPAALALLEAFEADVARTRMYPDLVRKIVAKTKEVLEAHLQSLRLGEQAYDDAVLTILRALRAGEVKVLAAEVELARANPRMTSKRRDVLRDLSKLAKALGAVQDAALVRLEAMRIDGDRPEDVRVRTASGAWETHHRWSLQGTDFKRRVVHVRRRLQKGSRPEIVEIPIERVDLERVLGWAQRSGKAVPPLGAPLVALSLLGPVSDDPGVDLRVRLGEYREVLADFERLAPDGAWTELVRLETNRLDGIQRRREDEATHAAVSINFLFNKPGPPEYKRVIQFWERLSDKAGRLRYTDAFDANHKDLSATAELCVKEIEAQELLSLFHGGVDVEDIGKLKKNERHRIRFDFDDPPQMENFLRVFGELEPTGGAITPVARGYRLHLLKGVEGLVLDRPLSLQNMFDTGKKISVAFSIDTSRGRGASILAVDIDGVQIAISSLDPNYWRWKFPFGTPLLDDEEQLPEYDFYGRARGIAFHEGENFGRSFPLGGWGWTSLSDAANFEKWKDRSYIRKRRDQLFAFAPGLTYRVVIERERDTLRLIVDGELIVQRKQPSWSRRGKGHTAGSGFRGGSDRIQILTTTPLSIDDLVLEGSVTERWRDQRKREIEAAEKAARKKAAAAKKASEKQGR